MLGKELSGGSGDFHLVTMAGPETNATRTACSTVDRNKFPLVTALSVSQLGGDRSEDTLDSVAQ